MGETSDFAQKAREAEALAAGATHPMIRVFLEKVARDYRALAGRESPDPVPGS